MWTTKNKPKTKLNTEQTKEKALNLLEYRAHSRLELFDKLKVFAERETVNEVLDMLEDSPEQLWLLTREGAGISKEFYDEYFCGREVAFAYKLGRVHIFETPKELSEFGVKAAPQSYIYIEDSQAG